MAGLADVIKNLLRKIFQSYIITKTWPTMPKDAPSPYEAKMTLLNTNPIYFTFRDNKEWENYLKGLSKKANKDFCYYLIPVFNIDILGWCHERLVLPKSSIRHLSPLMLKLIPLDTNRILMLFLVLDNRYFFLVCYYFITCQ